ncbi:hypothetical protein A2801_00250 [Candidatus Woesebacteria bacterium RIFCSPHIGHO2_01_FULL_41_10]|uniref:Solute-binding protein family 5 domain-containing protein n=1 Tax=Candidatus Woesebacteria bacterium RIFCSPHIGHO2_01_FULL_41_10 TaxID=1802500 RepID=A0A1F7YSC4_9BACT|nr:MAG: hypothetical protein A2801_00250 [Candidatus Woesebacteria bacterium RIFCSPHIGHO2_01_FULL_41_10]
MKSYRYWVRFLTTFIVRFRAVLFIGIIIGLLLFAVLRVVLPSVVGNEVERIGLTGRFHTESLPTEILSLVGQGLTSVNDTGEVQPALAEKWETNSEGTEWIFVLKDGYKWHDGTLVTAGTVQYSFEDAQLERIDDKTVKFKLHSPFAPFPTVVSRPTFKRGLLGTGEWKVRRLSLAGEYVSELVLANTTGDVKIFRFFPTEEQTKLAFELGEIDSIIDLLDPSPLNNWNTVKIEENIHKEQFVAVFFNTAKEPFADNKPLRQALSYATNKIDFPGPRATGPVSPQSWAYNSQVKEYEYDPQRAKELLLELGSEALETLEITLTTSPSLLGVAEKVASNWAEAGVVTNVQVVSAIPSDFQAFLAIYDIPNDPDQYAMWHSTQKSTNITGFESVRIDKLLEDGRLELDQNERKKIYLDFQRFLLEDAPAIFLFHPVTYSLERL